MSAALWACADETATLTEAVEAGGRAMAEVPGPAWRRAVPLTFGARPQIVVAPTGAATTMWSDQFGIHGAHRPSASSSWVPLILRDRFPVSKLWIRGDDAGAVTVAWTQGGSFPSPHAIWVNHFVPADGSWGTPRQVQPAQQFHPDVDLAVSSSGDAVVVWTGVEGGASVIRAIRFTAATGWQAPQLVESVERASLIAPRVGIDAHGNAAVIWEHRMSRSVMVSRSTGAAWSTPEAMTTSLHHGFGWGVAAHGDGNAVAVWGDAGGAVVARRFTPAAGWAAIETIGVVGDGHDYDPNVVANDRGTIAVAWLGGSASQVMTSRFTPQGGWVNESIPAIDAAETARPSAPSLALGATDDAFLLWSVQEAGSGAIWGTSSAGTGAWRTPQVISINPRPAFAPRVAIEPAGGAVAVWHQLVPIQGSPPVEPMPRVVVSQYR